MDVECCGCGGLFPDVPGPTHPHLRSSPGCWAAYNEVLARESDHGRRPGDAHRLTVDAYAVQHSGDKSAANVRSVGFHLCRLCLLLERGLDPDGANASIAELTAMKSQFIHLPPLPSLATVTVADVREVGGPEHLRRAVRRWAESVWRAWAPHHVIVRDWVDTIFPGGSKPAST